LLNPVEEKDEKDEKKFIIVEVDNANSCTPSGHSNSFDVD